MTNLDFSENFFIALAPGPIIRGQNDENEKASRKCFFFFYRKGCLLVNKAENLFPFNVPQIYLFNYYSSSRGQFRQHFTQSFYAHRSQKRKKILTT